MAIKCGDRSPFFKIVIFTEEKIIRIEVSIRSFRVRPFCRRNRPAVCGVPTGSVVSDGDCLGSREKRNAKDVGEYHLDWFSMRSDRKTLGTSINSTFLHFYRCDYLKPRKYTHFYLHYYKIKSYPRGLLRYEISIRVSPCLTIEYFHGGRCQLFQFSWYRRDCSRYFCTMNKNKQAAHLRNAE